MNKNKMVSIMAVIIIVVAGVFFYVGMKYAEGKSASSPTAQAGAFQGRGGSRQFGARGANGGFTSGEVITKDATSITIKTQDGGSKIILISPTTPVMKTTAGTLDDVAVGKTISVTGTANSDGSVTATQVQLRPAQPVSQTPPATPKQ